MASSITPVSACMYTDHAVIFSKTIIQNIFVALIIFYMYTAYVAYVVAWCNGERKEY